MLKWYEEGVKTDVVVSSRIRLARNLKKYPFPNKLSLEQKFEVIQVISDAILKSGDPSVAGFRFIDMDKISKFDAYAMAERHLISPDFAENGQGRALILSEDESVSIMINEEDHVRIQVMVPGFDLMTAYKRADQIDRILEQHVEIAFDENLGYLTECPTNLGTGMRASAMLHIPALQSIGAVGQIANTVSKIGLTMRGTFGEGSEVKCDMYQLSNQVTLGISEQAAIENLQGIIRQIVERERESRNNIDHDRLEDVVFRALGILKSARLLSGDELLQLISRVRLGVEMDMIKDIGFDVLNTLTFNCQSAALQAQSGGPLDADTRDKMRARIVREKLA